MANLITRAEDLSVELVTLGGDVLGSMMETEWQITQHMLRSQQLRPTSKMAIGREDHAFFGFVSRAISGRLAEIREQRNALKARFTHEGRDYVRDVMIGSTWEYDDIDAIEVQLLATDRVRPGS